MQQKKVIAFVTGGYSGEAEISYKSAITIGKNLDREKFDVYKIDIRKDGWFYLPETGDPVAVNQNGFIIELPDKTIRFDAVLIGIHGTPGEDGKLQGYFDLQGLPYTSCDAATSALTFNKRYTVAVAAFAGINVARSLHLFRERPLEPAAILDQLKLPVFVKPNNGGSSIGMSKVSRPEDLEAAIQKAFGEDNQVLIEEFITGREFTIGVFQSKGEIITLPFTEIIAKNEFFDFEAKYAGKSEEITPAQVDIVVAEKVREAARKVYRVFNCRGIIRIDFIYNEAAGAPYMLEINTVPGQSEASIVPQQVRAMGWTLKDFYSALIEDALEHK
ncbi:D-alanine--D-alanine ligase [Flavihumibacter petaseus]|uniref:D-alanine--D-alanine ligase n=1 Tax=Flavihumibacter petaseus NBRC 106054 TaxID=1220578 RepID=A0A0E9N7A3_9BACT|nr:D-alanine--D-alanine ligase [Flavihumibacter petaseus]GAO45709.1 D-alanine--D-alanine ligase [Flavihumibacter petaseus NBRC 106054]